MIGRRSFRVATTMLCTMVVSAHAADARAHGESDAQGFPNWGERVMHEWSNRARCEPQVEMAQCGSKCPEAACYGPMAPLWYSNGHNRAARFHCDEMVKQSYFAHNSACAVPTNISSIYPSPCDGSASCACTTGTPTTWSQRVTRFASSASGEIIASNSDPNGAFYAWLYETFDKTACAYDQGPPTNGHRWLILKSTGVVGYGSAGRSVGDMGSGSNVYKIPSAAHYPRQSSSVEVWANWWDTAAPKSARVNVGGACTTMTRKRGGTVTGSTTMIHEAWSGTLTNVATGCHRYVIEFVDSANNTVVWPSTGSLGIGPAASCPDWDTTKPPACGCVPNCAGKQCGDDGCGGQCGTCTSPATCNASGQCVTACTPNCTGKQCGDDGCGGLCPPGCTAPSVCQGGTCLCIPDCSGKQCGSDGCGGTCGTCSAPDTCSAAGQCVCVPACAGKQCGDDTCGGSCGTCTGTEVCVNSQCVGCTPNCTGKECGDDGCNGTCGPDCPVGQSCQAGQCQDCAPSCDGKECGDDGCNGTCPPGCEASETCTSAGTCECVPDCVGKQCGSDGCNGSCGTCSAGLTCNADGVCGLGDAGTDAAPATDAASDSSEDGPAADGPGASEAAAGDALAQDGNSTADDSADEDGGCGCAAPGGGRQGSWLALLAVVALLVRRRRVA